jgi:hypothetical protein
VTGGSFDPVAFYDLSREILSFRTEESYLRTSVGRAYYACFHLARLALQRKWRWVPPEQGSEHSAVIRELARRGRLPLSHALRDLRYLRDHADYDLDTPVDAARCDRARELADWLVARLRTL